MSRDAFRGALIYEHRSPLTSVTSTALDYSQNKLFLGLSDGHIEEYTINSHIRKQKAHLSARKSLSSKVCLQFTAVASQL